MKFPASLLSHTLLLGILITSPLLAQPHQLPKPRKLPFHGKLLSVNAAAQTITIAGKNPRIFYLTPMTKITDGSGNPSSLAAAVVDEDVGGSYTKDSSGRMTLFSVRLGAKSGSSSATTMMPAVPPVATPSPYGTAASTMETAPATGVMAEASMTPAPSPSTSPTPHKERFAGKVVSFSGDSLVVHGRADQTFTLTPTTKITNKAGKHATSASLKPGVHIVGTYAKLPDGTLTVYTLKIGK